MYNVQCLPRELKLKLRHAVVTSILTWLYDFYNKLSCNILLDLAVQIAITWIRSRSAIWWTRVSAVLLFLCHLIDTPFSFLCSLSSSTLSGTISSRSTPTLLTPMDTGMILLAGNPLKSRILTREQLEKCSELRYSNLLRLSFPRCLCFKYRSLSKCFSNSSNPKIHKST